MVMVIFKNEIFILHICYRQLIFLSVYLCTVMLKDSLTTSINLYFEHFSFAKKDNRHKTVVDTLD